MVRFHALGLDAQTGLGRAAQRHPLGHVKMEDLPASGILALEPGVQQRARIDVYKRQVQRSADVISIGPMLQGLNKPVNDLSRGALVEDIVFTIALTAIQAEQAADRARGQR